jgi:hypothetical protein
MTLSKKYKEEMNKIVMNEEMKKRILNNVLNENSQTKRKKYHLRKIHIQIAAACFFAVICFSAAKNFVQKDKSLPKQISQNTYDKNKNLDDKEQHSSIDTNSPKNKLQENTNSSNKLHTDEKSSDKKEGNLRNSGTNIPINTNIKNSDNVKNDKGTTQEEAAPKDNSNNNLNEPPAVTGGNPIKEYKTIEEAEDAVKFKINTIKVLPDKFNVYNISVISEEIIQIEYNNGKDTINFRAKKSIDDISGDYSKYEFEKDLRVNNKYIKIKGHAEGKVNLALWQIEDISYSLSALNGIEEERISEMIKDSF